jgi:hypothetical protein
MARSNDGQENMCSSECEFDPSLIDPRLPVDGYGGTSLSGNLTSVDGCGAVILWFVRDLLCGRRQNASGPGAAPNGTVGSSKSIADLASCGCGRLGIDSLPRPSHWRRSQKEIRWSNKIMYDELEAR